MASRATDIHVVNRSSSGADRISGIAGSDASAWPHRMVAATLALSAAVTALYLGSFQVGWLSAVWDPLFGMGSAYVLESYLSRTFESFVGVPDAIVGAAAYGVETLLLLSGGHRRAWTQPWLTVACGALTGILALTGLGLVLVQASIHHWCFLCLVTAGISWCLAALTWNELVVAVQHLNRR